jgi:hypothetical protein
MQHKREKEGEREAEKEKKGLPHFAWVTHPLFLHENILREGVCLVSLEFRPFIRAARGAPLPSTSPRGEV